jgi:hypothetical protein
VFEGGNPYKSSAKTVNVRFYDSGHFSFSLTAFKDSIQDSLIRKDFIKVIDQGYYVGQVGHMYDTMVKMKMRQNIVTKTDKPELFATFFLKDTYEGGFNILEVNDGFRYLGPASDYAIVAEEDRDDEEPLFDFYRGSIEYNEVPFTYNESEMYYLGVDFELNKVALVPYHQWSVTGDALVEASDSDILLEKEFINENGFSFKMNSTPMVYGTYHIRYNGAWNVILDSTYSNEGFETDGLKLSLKIGFYHNQCDWGIWAIENFYTGNETGIFTWNYKNEFKWDANF